MRRSDGGRPGSDGARGRGGGFAQVMVAAREDGGVAEGSAQLTVAGWDDGGAWARDRWSCRNPRIWAGDAYAIIWTLAKAANRSSTNSNTPSSRVIEKTPLVAGLRPQRTTL